MLKKLKARRAAANRHRIAMAAARTARSNAVVYRLDTPTTSDVINLAYGSHGIRLGDDEAKDALAAELAKYGVRLSDSAA